MKIKNYKNIRIKPLIFGFSFQSAIIFSIIVFVAMSILITGITLNKIIISGVIIIIGLLFCKYVIGEENVFERFFDEKFPDELNDFTKNGRKKY